FLFRPGQLTSEYNAGRRVRYSSPLRIYLLMSVAYFFAASVVGPRGLRFEVGSRQQLEQIPGPRAQVSQMRASLNALGCMDSKQRSQLLYQGLVENIPKGMLVLLPLCPASPLVLSPLESLLYRAPHFRVARK